MRNRGCYRNLGWIFGFALVPFCAAAPNAPSNLEVHLLPGQLHLTWHDNSSDEFRFRIEMRRTPFPGNWEVLDEVAADITSYQVLSFLTGWTYSFRVLAWGEYGASEYSNVASITPAVLISPFNLTGPDGGEAYPAGSVCPITWTNLTDPPSRVAIDYSTDSGSRWTTVVGSYPNTGSYYWLVPDTMSMNCRIRLRGTTGTAYDLSKQAFSIAGYDFDLDGLQGWTTTPILDEDGYTVEGGPFMFVRRDDVDYPGVPGLDPAGNRQAAMGLVLQGQTSMLPDMQNPLAEYWYVDYVSPVLTNIEYWQKAQGVEVQIAHCLNSVKPGGNLYSNIILEVFDTVQNKMRFFTHPVEAWKLTYCEFKKDDTWNPRSFLWKVKPGFPTDYEIQRIRVRIWGDLYWKYEGGVYLDHVKAIWPKTDFSGDGKVGADDFAAFATGWLSDSTDAIWNPVFNLDATLGNQSIVLSDLLLFVRDWLGN